MKYQILIKTFIVTDLNVLVFLMLQEKSIGLSSFYKLQH